MVKKKVVKKKVSKKKPIKKSPTKNFEKVIEKKKMKTAKLLFTSVVIFILSYSAYLLISIESVYIFFGLIAILSGSLILLSLILELTFYLIGKARRKN